MLYEGAIRFIKQAKLALGEKDLIKTNELVIKAQDITSELMITLDRSVPISEQLLIMYEYLHRRLVEANVRKDVAILSEVQDFYMEFRNTWKEAMILAKK